MRMPRLFHAPSVASVVLALAVFSGGKAQTEALPFPDGDVILTVGGVIANVNGAGVLALDGELLASLPQHSVTTSTIWTEGTATYTGVLVRDLLAVAGATGDTLTLTALNDYSISMPTADLGGDGPLLAYLVDGQPMSVRDKGPVWMIYPFDDVASYRTEQTYSRSIWQLTHIEVSD